MKKISMLAIIIIASSWACSKESKKEKAPEKPAVTTGDNKETGEMAPPADKGPAEMKPDEEKKPEKPEKTADIKKPVEVVEKNVEKETAKPSPLEKTLPSETLLTLNYKTSRGKVYKDLVANLKKIKTIAGKSKGKIVLTGKPLACFKKRNSKTMEVELYVPVEKKAKGYRDFKFIKAPERHVAHFVHKGGYKTVYQSWKKLIEDAKAAGLNIRTDKGCEIYLKDPVKTKAKDMEVEIYFKSRKAGAKKALKKTGKRLKKTKKAPPADE
ncbi:GyrI-like domain-containing protein [Myxococcota bacterium]|nr:GyrI-like domain-containing protein [Myxococcota bacterium]MBU1380824.1 GyrI-like domain-containing protein [Myxococcota bacterium]MBU1496537.1 GyrI-like domain-containing protein [Myxococcota bacterium]